ncbi:Ig domain protein, group 1 domain protein [Salinisphaera sp. PC39]|uniref:Ig-like domain-containing protein n=1 Tax=Salinisphaera sp. PC39 TaxID=1304156 RepID=UPI0033418FE3
MIERHIRYVFLAMLTALLMSCGGTGGSDENDDPEPPPDGGQITPGVTLIANTTSLPSNIDSNTNGAVELTALIRDENNNVVQGQTVAFSADSGAIQTTQSVTDEAGTATAVLHTAGNPRNRTIAVQATSGGESDSINIQVTGTTIDITGPAALALGGDGTYTITLADAAGDGIANEAVNVSSDLSNTFSSTNLTTGPNGQVQVDLNANNAGTDTLTASSLGISNDITVEIGGADFQFTSPDAGVQIPLNTAQAVTLRWLDDGSPVTGQTVNFSTSRGTLSSNSGTTDGSGEVTVDVQATNAGPATITASDPASGLSTQLSVQFVATVPDSIDVQANPATVGPSSDSEITAVVRDSNNNLVTGAIVDFTLDDTTNGSLRDGSVTTDTRGVASTVYTSGSTSAAEPAEITAQVRGSATINDTVEVTVGGQALRIVLGTGNELEEPNLTTYRVPYSAIVTDASGNPVPDADFRLSIRPLAYQEGEKQAVDIDQDGTADQWQAIYEVGGTSNEFRAGCPNEDVNENDILDDGEDINGNGQLDPTNVATVPTDADLDENGAVEFGVTYPQEFSQWVRVRLRAVASVQGTESTANAVFVLPMSADDATDLQTSPPGQKSPFGEDGDCTTIIDPDTGQES